jgi:putative ABC transport system permease protein
MFSLYRTLSLRALQQRFSRALLVVASIALGVATLVATRVLNQSMWAAVRVATNPLGFGELCVSNGDSGVRTELTTKLSGIPGIRDVEPVVVGRVRLPDLGDHRHAQCLGIVWKPDSESNNPWGVSIDWTVPPDTIPLLKGADPQNVLAHLKPFRLRPFLVGVQLNEELTTVAMNDRLDTILPFVNRFLKREWADQLSAILKKTAVIRLQPVGQEAQYFVKVGTVRSDGPTGDLVKNALILNAADAAELKGQPDLFTRIDLFLDSAADLNQVRSRVVETLGGRAAVRTSDENEQRAQEMMAGLQLGFSLTGAGALVVGLFLVYIVLAVTVAERRHEIGILRSLGATRGQIWALFVGEAGFQGLLGAALGIPAGLAMAHLCLDFIKNLLSDILYVLESPGIQIGLITILLAAAAGILTAIVAALVPAVRAAQEQPADAVRRTPQVPGLSHQVLQLIISVTLLILGGSCMIYRAHLPARLGTYGGFTLVLIGLLLTTPLLAASAARILQPLASRLMGLEGRLASDNLIRVPGRTGLVITVLAAGVAIFLQTAGVIHSNKDPFLNWINQSWDADLYVTSGSIVIGSGQNLPMERDLGKVFQNKLPIIETALPLRSRQVDYGENAVFLIALDAHGFYDAPGRRGPLMDRELYVRLLAPGGRYAVVSKNFAALYGVKEKDTIQLRGPHGPIQLEVAGIVADYSFPRGTVFIDQNVYQELFEDPRVDQFYVYLRSTDSQEGVRRELLRNWEAEHALMVMSRGQVRDHLLQMIRRFSLVAYSQEVVVGVVAALGVVFALLISVLQRRRELGILRAVGATQGQILLSVLAEAMLMGIIGTAIGLIVGVAIEWYCVYIILFEEAGFLFPVLIPWAEVGWIAAGAMIIATLAGLGPALRTMQLRIPEAIAYE